MIKKRKLLLWLIELKNSRDQLLKNQFEMKREKKSPHSTKRNLLNLKSLLIREHRKYSQKLNENSKIMKIRCWSNLHPRNQDLDLRPKSLLKKIYSKRNVRIYYCNLIFTSCLKSTKTLISIMMESLKDLSILWLWEQMNELFSLSTQMLCEFHMREGSWILIKC